jgi:hypothetical protein
MRAFGRQHYDITARVERRSKRDGGEVLDSSEVELIQSSWDVEEYLCQLLRPMSASAGKTLVTLPPSLPPSPQHPPPSPLCEVQACMLCACMRACMVPDVMLAQTLLKAAGCSPIALHDLGHWRMSVL